MMKSKQSLSTYLLLFLVLITLRTFDLYVTYKITPDLMFEWNPLVTHMAFSWGGLVVTQLIIVLFALWGYQRYANRNRSQVTQPGLGLRRFVFHYFNGHDANWSNWTRCFFKLPNKHYLKANGAFIGFVLVVSCIAISLFAIAHNLLILSGLAVYLEFVYENSSLYFMSVFIGTVLLSANLFFVTEFRAYRDVTLSKNE